MCRNSRSPAIIVACLALLVGAGQLPAQEFIVSHRYPVTGAYYPVPAVSYYAPPVVSYYAPPVVSYYRPPVVSYYAPPAISYYPAPQTVYYPAPVAGYTRYGPLGRPRGTVYYYSPGYAW